MNEPPGEDRIRAAEVMAAMCLATDLGMGFPFEHGLQATTISMRLVGLLGLDDETARQTYYLSLLMYLGCTTETDVSTHIFRGGITTNITPVQFGSSAEALRGVIRALPPPGLPLHRRALEVARRLPSAATFRRGHFAAMCEVAEMLADRLGMPPSVHGQFRVLTERWDGAGVLDRAEGEGIPLALRIVHVARDAAFQRLFHDERETADIIARRGGGAFDPVVADLFVRHANDLLAVDTVRPAWEAVLAVEPRPWLMLEGGAVDRSLSAMADFADLVSPSLAGHSRGVAELSRRAAGLLGLDGEGVALVARAALVHDLGRVAVHPRVWLKPEGLTTDEWEQVRLHPYHTERLLARSPFLAALGRPACAHHERLDGSGYHRGSAAASLPPPARILAAADAFHAMCEPRPHRQAHRQREAARVLRDDAAAGRLDPEAVAAVLQAAGEPAQPLERAAGLTEREAEVVALIARGLQTKQVATSLGISGKTVDRHIQNAYRKMGVSTRAAATVFAMEHGLTAWGELPIGREGRVP